MVMKKLLALILALVMTVCLFAACSEEKEEGPKDETATVRPLAEDALELFVKRDQEKLLPMFTDPDPAVKPAKDVVDKYTAYDSIVANFEAQVDTWGIEDEELKKEVKEYGKKKADEIYAMFKADGIKDVSAVGVIINANGKAKLLNVTAAEYEYAYPELYTAPGNYAIYIDKYDGEQPAKKLLGTATAEEVAANTALADACKAADTEAKAKLATMTIDDFKPVVDAIFAKMATYVVDTDVSIQYKKDDKGEWKIGMFSVSVIEAE